ncbi:MAG: ATP-binding protein [Pseudomonadota bacterium]
MSRANFLSYFVALGVVILAVLAFVLMNSWSAGLFFSALLGLVIGLANRRDLKLPDTNIREVWSYFFTSYTPYRRSWSATPDIPIVTIDEYANVTSISPTAAQILGVRGVATPIPFEEIFDGFGQASDALCRSAVRGPRKQNPILLKAKRIAEDSFVQLSWLPPANRQQHRSALITDATELKSLETQFVQGQKMQAIGQLAGGVAHDFNNLLTAISGYCDLLLLDKTDKHPDYADLRQISNNANRAAGLVAHLLAFSRRQALRPEILNINNLVSQLSALLDRLVGEKITLAFERGQSIKPVFADGRQLEQVLMNLVVNARDAMPEGGVIKVQTDTVGLPAGWRQDGFEVPPGEYVVIEVTDCGVGMDQSTIEKIFEPFFTTKKTGEGTGLGLSTVYGIVKQSGGYVFVDSTLGHGTRFSVFLPVHVKGDLPKVIAPEPQELRTFGLSGTKVLLVEDEAPVRAFASRALAMQGVLVQEADSAEAAMTILEDQKFVPDLVVSDVVMPGMNGPEWIEKVRADRPSLKVIFVSGYAEDVMEKARERIDGAMFLPKPYSLASLIEAVQNLSSS